MMTTETKTNYTEEQTTKLVQDYQAGKTVEQLAEALGKSVRSVVAKLSREGVYQAKTRSKGEGRVTKADLVRDMALQCGVDYSVLESLEKASVEALRAVHNKLM